jgi:hypothetical protein
MDDIDQQILSAVSSRWQKVARIIAVVAGRTGEGQEHDNHCRIAKRIEALVDSGQLEVQGNIARWRFSEVRLVQPAES